jgi:hypothetical protein
MFGGEGHIQHVLFSDAEIPENAFLPRELLAIDGRKTDSSDVP